MPTDPVPAPGVVVGVGMSSAATAAEVEALVNRVLDEALAPPGSLRAVATVDALAADPRLAALGAPVLGFAAAQLGSVPGVQPSPVALAATGTRSVAEAAALLGAGEGAVLAVTKRRSGHATAALAARPPQAPAPVR